MDNKLWQQCAKTSYFASGPQWPPPGHCGPDATGHCGPFHRHLCTYSWYMPERTYP